MAQSNQNTGDNTGNTNGAATAWSEAAARAKYAVHGGVPLLGISPETGNGFIVPLPAPAWFATITDAGMQDNVFRAIAGHAQRVGQGAVKGTGNATRDKAVAGVASVVSGTYKPGREVTNDILESETATRFENLIREKLAAAGHASPTEKQLADTVAKQAATEAGKQYLAKFREEVVADATYTPSRKGKNAPGGAIELAL